MTNRQLRAFQSITNVIGYTAPGAKVDHPRIRVLRAELQKSHRRIDRMMSGQFVAKWSRGANGYATRHALDVLRTRHMIPIVRDARAILDGLPGIGDALRVPHKMAPLEEHLRAAERIRDAVAPHARAFLPRQYPADFVEQLDRAAKDLEQAASNPGADRTRLSLLTRELREETARARAIIRRMDAVVCAEFYGDRSQVEEWRQQSRVPARQGRPPKKRVRSVSRNSASPA